MMANLFLRRGRLIASHPPNRPPAEGVAEKMIGLQKKDQACGK
jgi:hypothetical protein